jgi:hypothetical protein
MQTMKMILKVKFLSFYYCTDQEIFEILVKILLKYKNLKVELDRLINELADHFGIKDLERANLFDPKNKGLVSFTTKSTNRDADFSSREALNIDQQKLSNI